MSMMKDVKGNYLDCKQDLHVGNEAIKQAECETEEDCWHENCKRFGEFAKDLSQFNAANRRPGQFYEPMRCLQINSDIVSAVMKHNYSRFSGKKALKFCRSVDHFQRSMKALLEYREVYEAIKLRGLDQFNTKMTFNYNSNGILEWYGISVPEQAGQMPFDHVIVRTVSKTQIKMTRTERLASKHVILPMNEAEFHIKNFKDKPLNISFVSSGSYFAAQHDAIHRLGESQRMQLIAIKGEKYLPRPIRDEISLPSADTSHSELHARLYKLDKCQRKAVLGILQARCWPRSYIISGAPGTGKSHTIVEAIFQILNRSDMKVLICVQSDICADYLYDKLRAFVPKSCILRLQASKKSRLLYYDHRIVITTHNRTSELADSKTLFDYIFIDEANYSEISESLVPIRMLKEEGCLVLAGDLNLFNCTADTTKLLEKGVVRSLLQHVSVFKVYKTDSGSGNSNNDYITHLISCHRSDKRIMATLNELFYEGRIESRQRTPRSLLNLMQLSRPVQFIPVVGQEDTPVGASMSLNENEANICVSIIIRMYKMGLEPDQIGAISPSELQVQLISSKLDIALRTHGPLLNQRFPMRLGLLGRDNMCKIGTINDFRGYEREIIIISTVGSSKYIDLFAGDQNRFITSISRAKWLVIIVGNLDALSKSECLSKLIANGRTDEIVRWPEHSDEGDPFRQVNSLFKDGNEPVVIAESVLEIEEENVPELELEDCSSSDEFACVDINTQIFCNVGDNLDAGVEVEQALGTDWKDCCERYTQLKEEWGEDSRFRCFTINNEVHLAVMDKNFSQIERLKQLNQCESFGEYISTLYFLVHAEELYQAIELRKADQCDSWIIYSHDYADDDNVNWYGVHVPGLSEKQPALVRGDYVIMRNKTGTWSKAIEIVYIIDNNVILKKNRCKYYRKHFMQPLDISFISSGLPFAICRQALSRFLKDSRMQTIALEHDQDDHQQLDEINYFPRASPLAVSQRNPSRRDINLELSDSDDLLDRLAKLNDCQYQAVVGILRAECWPKAYILFGPPGTGKSHTIIEAVVQIHKRFTKLKVLICINANTCVDHMHEKLLAALPGEPILRLRAGDNARVAYNRHLHRIVVTTNIKAGRLAKLTSFDYVFIDEAGHASEPESMVPISLLEPFDGCLVLAGDPQQLGPVVLCQEAAKYGLDTSLLERIYGFGIYQRDVLTNRYNEKFITKLLQSYRCDERILATSNELFYHNELICANKTPTSILNIMQLSGPVQLLQVSGQELRPERSTSLFNIEEAEACVDLVVRLYKIGFEPEQIGVITPYRSQSREIFKRLERQIQANKLFLNERFHETQAVEIKSNLEGEPLVDPHNYTHDELVLQVQDCQVQRLQLEERIESESASARLNNEFETTIIERDWMCKIDTVDAFQGNEREVIIISTVRTTTNKHRLGFLNDRKRFNVAISRAKWLLIVVGHPDVLSQGQYWPRLIENAKEGDIKRWPTQSNLVSPFEQTISLFKAN